MDAHPSISAIIPTLNAADRLPVLVRALQKQTLPPQEIFIIDSNSEDKTVESVKGIDGIRIKIIGRDSFNHGTTRHEAFLETDGEYVCFFTDDAVPANDNLIEELIKPMDDPLVAMTSGKQLPRSDARSFEKLVRDFNYPDKSNVRTIDDIELYGIKAFFATDVCSAYRRSAYMEVGGFVPVKTNEDMYIAASFLRKGYKVAYVAEAQVIHSHNLTPKQQYFRYRDIGYFMATNKELLADTKATGEGIRLVKQVSSSLLREGQIKELLAFGLDCIARFLGNRSGIKLANSEQENNEPISARYHSPEKTQEEEC